MPSALLNPYKNSLNSLEKKALQEHCNPLDFKDNPSDFHVSFPIKRLTRSCFFCNLKGSELLELCAVDVVK